MRRVVEGPVLALALALAGCGDGSPTPAGARDDGLAPIESSSAAAPASALDAEQTAWLGDVAAQGLDALTVASGDGPDLDEQVASVGPRAPAIGESARPIRRETPEALLASALDALSSADVAALARLSRARDERPTLDEEDALEAERRFLAPAVQPYWRRVAVAARLGDISLEPGASPDEARLRVHVGGAMGSYVIPVRRRGDGWYLAS